MDLQLPETVFPERYYLGIFKQRAYQYHCMAENAHVIPLKLRVSIGGDDELSITILHYKKFVAELLQFKN